MMISIPSQVLIAFGALFAALLTGFFSFVNLVSAKENKVSEFRLNWIDGLRNEVSEFSAAIQEMIHIENIRKSINDDDINKIKSKEERELEWLSASTACYSMAESSLSKIQLRLNHIHVNSTDDTPEKRLMTQVTAARKAVDDKCLVKAKDAAEAVRNQAAPLLKSTWNTVKNGEDTYQRFRTLSQSLLLAVFCLVSSFSMAVLLLVFLGNVSVG